MDLKKIDDIPVISNFDEEIVKALGEQDFIYHKDVSSPISYNTEEEFSRLSDDDMSYYLGKPGYYRETNGVEFIITDSIIIVAKVVDSSYDSNESYSRTYSGLWGFEDAFNDIVDHYNEYLR